MSGLRAVAVLLTAAVVTALTVPAAADEPAAAAAPSSAPAASSPPATRPWLAHPQATEIPSRAPTAPWRPFAVVVFLGALGGAAVLARRRWKGATATRELPRLRVLDTVRVGEKSHLVVAQVGGRNLLLGVTPHTVRRIAWLKPETTDAPAAAASQPEDESIRAGFASALRKSFGYEPITAAPESEDRPKAVERAIVTQNAASLIAARTRDTVDVSPRAARVTARSETAPVEAPDPAVVSMIEGQVSGLKKRRR